MKGVFERFNLKVGQRKTKGIATISAFQYKREENLMWHLGQSFKGMGVTDGKYIRLHVMNSNYENELVMSDTDYEKSSTREFVEHACGRVLIAGLGIGLIIENIMPKLKTGEIWDITVIEKCQDVIDLVAPYYKHPKIKIICADIFSWEVNKTEKFDTIYFDIWPTINTDNLKEIRTLHIKFKNRLNRSHPYGYMNSWVKERLKRMKRSEDKENNFFTMLHGNAAKFDKQFNLTNSKR